MKNTEIMAAMPAAALLRTSIENVQDVLDALAALNTDSTLRELLHAFGAEYEDQLFDDADKALVAYIQATRAAPTVHSTTAAEERDCAVDAIAAADAVMSNLGDRRGVLSDIDEDVLEEIRDSIAGIIRSMAGQQVAQGEKGGES